MTQLSTPEHDEIAELLPWYVTDTLKSLEKTRVSQHLETCPLCRQELQLYRQLETAKQVSLPSQSWQPSSVQFAAILQGIDELEQAQAQIVPKQENQNQAKRSHWFKAIPNPVIWCMALETAALAALVLVFVNQSLPQFAPPGFETLSNASPSVNSDLPRLHVVFSDDITEQEIRTLLLKSGAQLTGGPSALGVYTLQLAVSDKTTVQQTVSELRAAPKIKLVEEIQGALTQ